MAIGDNLTTRDQGLIGVSVIVIALAAAYWYFVWTPKGVEITTLATHVDSLEAGNQRAKAQLAKGSIEQLKAEAKQYRDNLDVMRTLVPAGSEVPALLDAVSTAAKRVGLDIGTVEPEPVIEGMEFDTYRYKLKIQGGFHTLGQLFTSIGTLTRIVTPINVSLVPGVPPAGLRLPPNQTYLTSTFEIQTYVARTSPGPAPGSKVKK